MVGRCPDLPEELGFELIAIGDASGSPRAEERLDGRKGSWRTTTDTVDQGMSGLYSVAGVRQNVGQPHVLSLLGRYFRSACQELEGARISDQFQ